MIDQVVHTVPRYALALLFCLASVFVAGCKGYGGGLSTPQEEGVITHPKPDTDTPDDASDSADTTSSLSSPSGEWQVAKRRHPSGGVEIVVFRKDDDGVYRTREGKPVNLDGTVTVGELNTPQEEGVSSDPKRTTGTPGDDNE